VSSEKCRKRQNENAYRGAEADKEGKHEGQHKGAKDHAQDNARLRGSCARRTASEHRRSGRTARNTPESDVITPETVYVPPTAAPYTPIRIGRAAEIETSALRRCWPEELTVPVKSDAWLEVVVGSPTADTNICTAADAATYATTKQKPYTGKEMKGKINRSAKQTTNRHSEGSGIGRIKHVILIGGRSDSARGRCTA
jgi:hypothetical protein